MTRFIIECASCNVSQERRERREERGEVSQCLGSNTGCWSVQAAGGEIGLPAAKL